jgi:hypothetical protein
VINLATGKLKPEHPQLSEKITEPGKEPGKKTACFPFAGCGIIYADNPCSASFGGTV